MLLHLYGVLENSTCLHELCVDVLVQGVFHGQEPIIFSLYLQLVALPTPDAACHFPAIPVALNFAKYYYYD